MDSLIATTKASSHARSNSLPSKSHPLIVGVEDQLHRLRALSSATSSSPSIICQNLVALNDLFECVDNLSQLPFAHKAFCNEQQEKCVEDLLDMYGNTRDVVSHVKGCVQDIKSFLPRRNGQVSSLANQIKKYMISRKMANKMVSKCSGNLKAMQKGNLEFLGQDQDLESMVDMLREVEAVSFMVFKFFLSFVCLPKARSKPMSLISKLIQSKHVSCEEEIGNLEKIDGVLDALIRNKSSKSIDVQIQVQKAHKSLESLE